MDNDAKQQVIKRTIQRTKRYLWRNAEKVNAAIDEAQATLNFMDESTEQELKAVLFGDADVSLLSAKGTKALYWIITSVLVPMFVAYMSTVITTNREQLKDDLKDVLEGSEITAIVKQADTSYLSGYRITTVSSLNIRADNNLRSDVIKVIKLGTVFEVIEDTIKDPKSANKNWIKISLIEEDALGDDIETIGWVYRRFTIPVR
jgi:hypothetical protein